MPAGPHQPLARRILTPTTLVLLTLVAVGGYFLAQRFMFGLGAVTHLNPGYPWGLWVVLDVVIGTAFGCGGFAMALLVYVLNRGEYHPLMRPALLAGLFGYTLAGMAVMVDLGRYWQFYTLLLPWYAQPKSVMFEVALCVMAYVAVLWIEFSPAFLERFGLENAREKLGSVMFVIVALGVLLPTMHQSSLGSLLLVLGSKLSPLWYTEWLPLFYVTTALAMGYGVVILEAILVSRSFRLPSHYGLLMKVARIVGWLTLAFLAARIGELLWRDELRLAMGPGRDAALFWVENLMFLAAALVFVIPSWRSRERLMLLGAVALLVAGSLYRFDSYLIAYKPVGNWTYFPAFGELMVSIGFIALEVLLYLLFVKMLPVLHAGHAGRPRHA